MIAARMLIDTGTGLAYEVEDAGGVHEDAIPLFTRAVGAEFMQLSGERGQHIVADLLVASAHMRKNPATYQKFLPADTWITATSAANYLHALARMCERHPDAVLELRDANQ